MDEKVPYIAFEAEMARHERKEVRLIRVIIALIIAVFLSNAGWLWFFNQFNIEGETVSVDSRDAGIANYIGEDGTINNGRGDGK